MKRAEIVYHARNEIRRQATAACHSIYIRSTRGEFTTEEAMTIECEIKKQLDRLDKFFNLEPMPDILRQRQGDWP